MSDDRETFQRIAKGCGAEAAIFHALAAPVFAPLGLRLVNNPHERVGRFAYSSALYDTKHGPSLSAELELVDGNYMTMTFGRKWFFNGKLVALSNSYHVFARHVGMDVPESYSLGYQEQLITPFRAAIADIERSWKRVLAGLDDSVIDEAERSRFGALQHIAYLRQLHPSGVVTVDDDRVLVRDVETHGHLEKE
jgi:hypothetical protein